ncbi:polyprenyl diphosphate synthase [Streptomyces europaeiscabiei]|uniref:polyprenyl diphosphate synthase n=2 Tax=Streptomyces europaeiscabiei TaxID=146819 RepID=UPI0029AE671A|nr:polyprenyl diphosphate synthase [Streptomyces europaeiscabiei]MDX2773850.1 polyprenyl diphosphate synthase [Streptomyces europaeiscabiei]MDX3664566.1 polyprenyl diphosphate synthase [Streptomyces europaeiscabiei]MDX3708047.1 polyprenyl diphosphate synthase [Streptomyces europaeiscabiei]MDX3832401.1 polyprenyl diphosphate synthase [Streptomyces europaeiscabiei]
MRRTTTRSVTRSGRERSALDAAYDECRRLVRTTRPTEYALMQLMPPAVRPACWALYAALASADDLVDSTEGTPQERARRLQEWRAALDADLASGTSDDPVRRALTDAVWHWGLDLGDLLGSLDAVQGDEGRQGVATWQEWRERAHAQNVSWPEQLMRMLVRSGLPVPVRLRDLPGFTRFVDGLFLTDMLRDLPEDLDGGQVWFPAEVLDRFQVTPAELISREWTPAVRQLVAHLADQAREWLEASRRALRNTLPLGPSIVLDSAVELFGAELDAIVRAGSAVLHRPVRVPRHTEWRILGPARARAAVVWRLTLPPGGADTPGRTPAVSRAGATSPTDATTDEPASALFAGPEPHTTRIAEPPLPPRPHRDGARPPAIAEAHLPQHVAIVMDGNGRWATGLGLPRDEGHRAGAVALRDVVQGALEIGLAHLTVYAFSTENWKRSPDEVSKLFAIMRSELLDGELLDHDVRLRWVGSPDGLPDDVVEVLRAQEHATRNRTGLTFNVCVNYGGRAELTRAGAALARAALAGEVDPARVSEQLFAAHLPHHAMPDVDLLWRTSGEIRTSNFLPWHAHYAELHFTDQPWPDVDRRDLWEAVVAYTHRKRRKGAASAPTSADGAE